MKLIRQSAPYAAALLLFTTLPLNAASDVDSTFVGKVSQGGAYEVAASQYAETRAQAQDVKDLAVAEVHDHTLVGNKLKKISAAAGIPIALTLNTEFQQRLDKLKSTPKADFDAAYLDDMKSIHDKDEKLFAQESNDGTGAFKAFAAETDRIVKRHIGTLNAF
jgi:putative membrane protein